MDTAFVKQAWSQVQVGNVVCVKKDEVFPADLILLSAGQENGVCYVETSNIDGETNLKMKQACKKTMLLRTPESLVQMRGFIRCENPNEKIHSFEGTMLAMEEKEAMSLSLEQLLLRGSTLRNTDWIYGVAVYTGVDTKMLRNSNAAPLKRSLVERQTNTRVFYVFLLIIGLSLICMCGNLLARLYYVQSVPYLFQAQFPTAGAVLYTFGTFIILYHSLIPISLMVTMELVRIRLATLIEQDVQLWDQDTDTPASASNSSLVEELGQVQYLFTDKTGTLTRNQMRLLKLADKDGNTGDKCSVLLECMTRCHSVMVEPNGEYQGASPDEVAIVSGAALYKYTFKSRAINDFAVDQHGLIQEFNVLAVVEFSSDRRRMSVVYRQKTDRKRIDQAFSFCRKHLGCDERRGHGSFSAL